MSVSNPSSLLDGPQGEGPADGPELKCCQQCGRVGIRGFKVTPAQTVDIGIGPVEVPEFTECANRRACQRRWPKHPRDDD